MEIKGVTILLLEDDLLLAKELQFKLEELGYEIVASVQSGEDALINARRLLPDLAILDIEVDGEMDGLEAGAYIRKSLGIPIIYVTQFSDVNTFDKAKRAHPNSYLTKPINLWDLVRSIELSITHDSLAISSQKNEYFLSKALFLKSTEQTFEKVDIEDILFFKASGSYTEIHTSIRTFVFSENISYFDKKLKIPQLVRVHRSWIVNLEKIKRIEDMALIIQEKRIPIGKTYKKATMSYFNTIR